MSRGDIDICGYTQQYYTHAAPAAMEGDAVTHYLAGQTDGKTTNTPESQRGGDGYSEICRDHFRDREKTYGPGENRQGSVVDEALALVRL